MHLSRAGGRARRYPASREGKRLSNIDRIARSFEEEIELSLATTQLDVFVMGPSLDDDGPSGILRRWLIEEIRSLGASIDA